MQMPFGLTIKEQHRWIWLLLYSAAIVIATASCSGGGGTVQLGSRESGASPVPGLSRATGELITEAQIATLPAWQRDKLSDPGWNQPYIAPRKPTELPPPTYEMLQAFMEEQQARGLQIQPRLNDMRSASWCQLGGFEPEGPFVQGEMDLYGWDADPPYGCNSDPTNGHRDHPLDDVIILGQRTLPEVMEFVYHGTSDPNWFNTSGGSGNDAQSAVYQLYSDFRVAVPEDWEGWDAEFEELTYRADLAPGVGPGGDCSAATAYLVSGLLWKRFNSKTNCLPVLQERYVYDILIAPSSEESSLLTSSGHTDGRYQEFYGGSLSECFNGGWIVGVEASTSGCSDFDNKVVEAYEAGIPWYFSPIFGVLLKRWQHSELAGMAGPWEAELGWPVQGPLPFGNGIQTLSPYGACYAWGMWFERGFIWWVDYDQEAYPETPDEAQVYRFTGSNVFCPQTGDYEEMAPAVYYGGSQAWPAPVGEARVAVVVDSYRSEALSAWSPVRKNGQNEYEITLANDGLATVNVAMHAHAWGGTPNPDCSYDHYVWAFRDGTIYSGEEATAQYVTHTFGSDVRNMEGQYVVRVQVTDSTGAVAYGDSLPIRIGHNESAWRIWLVRNDNGVYDANYDALCNDLLRLGASYYELNYSPVIAGDINYSGAEAVIWYRGGPGAPDEPVGTRAWTAEEIDNLIAILEDGNEVLLVSQDHGYNSEAHRGFGWQNYYSWDENELSQSIAEGAERFLWALGMTEAAGIGISGKYGYLKSSPRNLPVDGPLGGRFAGDGYDNDGAGAAERYNGPGSCGDVPVSFSFGEPRQLVGYGMCSPVQNGVFAPSFVAGINCAEPFEQRWDIGFFSGGLTEAPYRDVGLWPGEYDFAGHGKGKLWWIGYPWAQVEVTDSATGAMVGARNRYMLLHNILGWLDDGLAISSQ